MSYPWEHLDEYDGWHVGDRVHVGDDVGRTVMWFVVTGDGIPRALTRRDDGRAQYVNVDRLQEPAQPCLPGVAP